MKAIFYGNYFLFLQCPDDFEVTIHSVPRSLRRECVLVFPDAYRLFKDRSLEISAVCTFQRSLVDITEVTSESVKEKDRCLKVVSFICQVSNILHLDKLFLCLGPNIF